MVNGEVVNGEVVNGEVVNGEVGNGDWGMVIGWASILFYLCQKKL